MKFAILGSGSKGNAAVIDYAGTRLLLDAGLSGKQLLLRLAAVGIDPATITAVLLTHEHGDHVRGLGQFLRRVDVPVYATAATARVVGEGAAAQARFRVFEAGQEMRVGELAIESLMVQHDAVDPVGFVIATPTQRLGYLSDLGCIPPSLCARLHLLDALFIEANYDEDLLEEDLKRPWSIKQRIKSRHGHLSNAQVMELIDLISHSAMRRLVFGHLSSDCNHPERVLGMARDCLVTRGHAHIELHCADQDLPSTWFTM